MFDTMYGSPTPTPKKSSLEGLNILTFRESPPPLIFKLSLFFAIKKIHIESQY